MLVLSLPHNTKHVAVALSGGPDSWALCLLAQEWCAKNNAQLIALTVDHKLRTGSTAEAESVAAECAQRGIAHHILTWHHDNITSRVQEQAREARYSLLTDYCRTHTIPLLLTAHHADDQAETVLLRFAKASDVGGLAGLQSLRTLHGVTLMRPLLSYTKQQLMDYVTAASVPFVIDPSNENERFARGRLRQARDALEAEGLTTASLVRLADKMRAADEALHYAAQALIINQFVLSPYGGVLVPLMVWENKPAALIARAILELWRLVTADLGHPVGHDQLRSLQRFIEQDDRQKMNLAGMVLEKTDGNLTASRELVACAPALTIASNSFALWDNRFMISNSTDAPVTVGALGEFGRDKIKGLGADFDWLNEPTPETRATLPALYHDRRLPLLIGPPRTKAVTASFLTAKSSRNIEETTLYSDALNLSIV